MRGLIFLFLFYCWQMGGLEAQIPSHIQEFLQETEHEWLTQQLDSAQFTPEEPCVFKESHSDFMGLNEGNLPGCQEFLPLLVRTHCSQLYKLKSLSHLYFPLFQKKLESLNLHDDYKYLAVLSGLNSTFDGASDKKGLWQLSFANAVRFALRVDQNIDERYAADLSTNAALALLKFLEAKYQGEPLKVIVAFTRGIGYVESLLLKSQSTSVNFEDLLDDKDCQTLKFLFFFKHFFETHQDQNTLFDYIDFFNTFENVGFKNDVSYYSLSHFFNMDESFLRLSNPTFFGDIIPADYQGVRFMLPKEIASSLTQQEDSLYAYEQRLRNTKDKIDTDDMEKIAKVIPDMTDRIGQFYTVRSGDVLGTISQKFDVRVSELRGWNNLKGDRIDVGQKLIIYPKKNTMVGSEASPTPHRSPTLTEGDIINYTVKSGESLWLIARRFPGVSAQNIMDWNGIDENIRPGEVLKILKP